MGSGVLFPGVPGGSVRRDRDNIGRLRAQEGRGIAPDPRFEDLGLPSVLRDLCDEEKGARRSILLDTPRIKDLIKRGETEAVKDAMEQGRHESCQTFDGAMFDLVTANRISDAEALKAADSRNNLRLRLDRYNQTGGGSVKTSEPVLRLAPVTPLKVAGGAR